MKKYILRIFLIFIIYVTGSQLYAQDMFAEDEGVTTEVVYDHSVLMYPNPVLADNFYVKSETGTIASVEVLNVIGQRVKKVINQSGVPNNVFVELPDTQKGMYMVRITFDDKKTLIRKIIVK